MHRECSDKLDSIRYRRTPEAAEQVKATLVANAGKISVRRIASGLNLSHGTVHRILKGDLKWHPYKLQLVQELKALDFRARVDFAEGQFEVMEQDPNFLANLFFTDEANFNLHGGVNHHNFRYWAEANPNWHLPQPLHSPHVTVWMGIGKRGVVGPVFFEDGAGRPVTVDGARYVAKLREEILPVMEEFEDFDEMIFMQDGATPHFPALPLLRERFPARWMGRGKRGNEAPYDWPARSPDLTPCDFFLWGYLKSRLYTDRPYRSIADLKRAIEREVRAIPEAMIDAAIDDYPRRLRRCIEGEGRSVELY